MVYVTPEYRKGGDIAFIVIKESLPSIMTFAYYLRSRLSRETLFTNYMKSILIMSNNVML